MNTAAAIESKIPVKAIELTRLEGRPVGCDKTHSVAGYEEASELLRLWSSTAPKDGGYDKCRFVITFEDGETYTGTYSLKHHTCRQETGDAIDLKARVNNDVRCSAGEQPAWMDDERWAAVREIYCTQEAAYKAFLARYDV